ncbi:MAG: DUF2147 domain-containing protein [Flavobacteriales bacterium]
MKRLRLAVLLFAMGLPTMAQSILGNWKTIDDETGLAESIVHIYEQEGVVFGRVVTLLQPEDKGKRCTRCKGAENDQPIAGMCILKGMKKGAGSRYKGGTIFDPKKGKVYRCVIWLDEKNPDILHVRGYIMFLYRTQVWYRFANPASPAASPAL